MTAAGGANGSTAADPITVFLLEDHDLVRESVAQLLDLESDLRVVSQTASAADALATIADTRPDVAVLDVRLKDGNGIEICRSIRERFPDVRCLMLTSFSDDRAVLDAAMAGASGFVLKTIRRNNLVETIRLVAGGARLLDDDTVRSCLDRLRASERDDIGRLTPGQTELFELIGSGRSNAQIAEALDLDVATVRNDISVLLRRLGMIRRTEVSSAYQRSHDETDATPRQVGL